MYSYNLFEGKGGRKGEVEIEEQHHPFKHGDTLLPSASHTQELHLASESISFLALSSTVLHLPTEPV